ncbi:MOFRL family protein [Halopiger aswanensis]|uniref:MOFRL family protein n=1 Tax=Halopiger aswanensis TaxID=148449 RepID=UPI001FEB5440|nr:MOFRL family protein [Halopiger aswanensis]
MTRSTFRWAEPRVRSQRVSDAHSKRIIVASVDTDGIDGGTDAAGAVAAPSDVTREEGRAALANNVSSF